MSTDWKKKWEDGEIRFHQSKYHPQLEKNGSRFSQGTILVPLCGKTLDMLYLANLGHSVIGVELSPIACKDFFLENGIKFTESTFEDFMVFESEQITLWCGDFFKLPQKVWNLITGMYDRAAIVALPEDIRQKYATEVIRRSSKHLEILLIAFEYPQAIYDGPPYSVSEDELANLYKSFAIEKLHTERDEEFSKRRAELESVEFKEITYWICK